MLREDYSKHAGKVLGEGLAIVNSNRIWFIDLELWGSTGR
jgi:hypothetical protein